MPNLDPSQIAAKYQRGVAGAAQDYALGVQNPARSWSQATVAGQDRWRQGVQDAIASGSFAAGVQKAGDAKWQQRAAGRGAQNYSAAANDAAAAYAAVAQNIVAAAQAARSAASSMPNATIEQRIARSAAAQRAVSQFYAGRR